MVARPGRERVWTENDEETRSVFWREGDRTILQVVCVAVSRRRFTAHTYTYTNPICFLFLPCVVASYTECECRQGKGDTTFTRGFASRGPSSIAPPLHATLP